MTIRKPAWTGQFYPADPQRLSSSIRQYLQTGELELPEAKVMGIIAPHAGYSFSGPTAGAAYATIPNNVETVVVLAPSHASFIQGVSLFSGDAYETPLGRVPVDKQTVEALAAASSKLHVSEEGHSIYGERAEHSLEVQLPFLQTVLGDFKLIPAILHDYSWENCRELGQTLADTLIPENTLIVASSDLYHGHDYDTCIEHDRLAIETIQHGDAQAFLKGNSDRRFMACGAGPIAALMVLAEQWNLQSPVLAATTNSADVTGMRGDYVVGYASLVYQQ